MRILSLAPLAGDGLDLLRALGDVELDAWNQHTPPRIHGPGELLERLRGVEVLIVEADHVGREVFERSGLRFLGVCRGDPVNVDVEAATKHGVVVLRTPGRNAAAVADLAIGFMLALLRHVTAADADVRAGRLVSRGTIPQQRYLGRELGSCTVGLVGFGAVAREVARRLRAFGARVLAYDPFVPAAEARAAGVEPIGGLGDLVAASDIVSVHAPLRPETRDLLGEAELARVRPGALLVNTARYGLVAEEPLVRALRDGRIGGAAFDHFENEFLPPDHPLTSFPNVILTPHIGGSTVETVANHTRQIAEGIRDVLHGKIPATVVNPEVLPIARP